MQQRKKEREDDEKSRMLRKEIEELKALLNQKKMEYDVHRKSKEACLSTASSQVLTPLSFLFFPQTPHSNKSKRSLEQEPSLPEPKTSLQKSC